MDIMLNAIEVRVLGSLMEKELATPEYYPLSLNALINACNQKTNRAPVLSLDEKTVATALLSLKGKHIVFQSDTSRVPKYWQNFSKSNNLIDRETALLAMLLLRGPQTAGELRNRTDNLHPFQDIEEVLTSLENLREAGLIIKMARQPGQKEQRFAHLLAGEPEIGEQLVARQEPVMLALETGNTRLAELERAVVQLQDEIASLKDQFLLFRKEFE